MRDLPYVCPCSLIASGVTCRLQTMGRYLSPAEIAVRKTFVSEEGWGYP